MACPTPAPDWGMTAVIAGLFGMVCLTVGTIWGQKTGPPRNWIERDEPPDPVAERSE